jgi:hypothetical protein
MTHRRQRPRFRDRERSVLQALGLCLEAARTTLRGMCQVAEHAARAMRELLSR